MPVGDEVKSAEVSAVSSSTVAPWAEQQPEASPAVPSWVRPEQTLRPEEADARALQSKVGNKASAQFLSATWAPRRGTAVKEVVRMTITRSWAQRRMDSE